MEFKDRLRQLRGNRTQKEIAELIGVSKNSYNNWENGREPSFDVLKKIAEFHHVTIDYLIGYDDLTHDTKNLTETYGLSDKAFFALKQLTTEETDDNVAAMAFLKVILESELLPENPYDEIIMRLPELRSLQPSLPQPTRMLSNLAARFIVALDAINEVDDIPDFFPRDFDFDISPILNDMRESVIHNYKNEISQLIETWLRYYSQFHPSDFG